MSKPPASGAITSTTMETIGLVEIPVATLPPMLTLTIPRRAGKTAAWRTWTSSIVSGYTGGLPVYGDDE